MDLSDNPTFVLRETCHPTYHLIIFAGRSLYPHAASPLSGNHSLENVIYLFCNSYDIILPLMTTYHFSLLPFQVVGDLSRGGNTV